ncbi:MAG: hypothetical protein OHK0046_12560 [Anaerolineae bacterium]
MPAPTPTFVPSVTLIVRLTEPLPTPTPPYLPPLVTPTGQAMLTPTCYETFNSGIVCLGALENTAAHPVGQAVVRVQLLDVTGIILNEQTVTLEQRTIGVGESAPYRALFPDSPASAFGGVQSELIGWEQQEIMSDPPLALESRATPQPDGRYSISIMLQSEEAIMPLRLIVTLYDVAGRVAAYRIIETDATDETQLRLETEVLPKVLSDDLTMIVHVEAR